MKLFLRSHSMGIAALALGVGVLLSRVLGLVRDKIISYYFGTSLEADLYFTAFVVPDFLNYLLAGGYFSVTLVPLLSSCFVKDEKDGWRFFSSAVCWAFISITCLTLIAFYFAPEIAHAIGSNFSAEGQERLAHLLRIILPAQVCFLPGACFSAVLYMRKQFTVPAITPLIYNMSIILFGWGMVLLYPERGIEGFCWGVLIGAALGSLILPLLAVHAGGMSFFPALLHPVMKRVLILALPLMLGQSIVALDEQFVRVFGALSGEGGASLLSYARRIMQVPVGVIAQAAGLASYPFLASLVASGKTGEFNNRLNSALTNTALVALPVSLWMITASESIIRIIFQQGSFTPQDASSAGVLLAVMVAAVIFWSMQQVLGRGFYAHEDMVSPALMGTYATIAVLPAYWFGSTYIGALGVAIAGSCGVTLYAVLLCLRWKKKHGSDALKGFFLASAKSITLCLPACLAAYGVNLLIGAEFSTNSLLGAFYRILASGITFLFFYFTIGVRFSPATCQPFTSVFMAVVKRIKK